ncbi:amino acid transporter [Lentilactobacillus kefiri]|uniref:APC family amino acid-polyamine-organocation transporter n=2 Tax=Lentilactobacillus kefiri TaxID=33962 RepID=A0A8E1RHU5_LENKE|nr:amino acid permease [Lentilactobacillus kefiri]KRL73642.1 APC family amino acid-polyamine-organocation transporter [Lentilactobacillus parakefiri DSM 10551]KRM49745.1 APC family amino acid-polyamine-organocation transporter [Lentilactobacillus kefiri DSM 20587 = JCM 5818]MCP9368202.1 amino acid permease [Lentilactobacillus kefiri]MDH5109612.1 amino acid permease [Lentilactobacillus kefiri]MDM7492671.1 amino acid permease [Lentilactobacillus kefiri]
MLAAEKIEVNKDGTRRGLSNLAVQMIAFGGSIGTGLFLGAGSTIHRTGRSIIFVYFIIGIFFFLMMRAIGEMMYADPEQHTFVSFIGKYVNQRLGKFAAWSYWLELILAGMAELTAISTYVKYWFPSVSAPIIQVLFLLILSGVNLAMVSSFGKSETFLSGIKVIAILALIVIGVYLVFTHHENPAGTHASWGNLTTGFSMFPNGIHQFIMAFPMVFFAFQGMEFVGITTAETKNPRKVLPKAVNQIIARILLFYIGSLIIIMAITPWKTLNPNQSPFVQIFNLAGIPGASAVINLVVIAAAMSTLNSAIFSTGRHLYQLAQESNEPAMKPFQKVSKSGIPIVSVLFSAGMMLLAPIISSFNSLGAAFSFIASVSSDIYILVCMLTVVAHWKYRHSKDFQTDGFKMPNYRWSNPLTIAFFIAIFASLFFSSESFLPALGAVIWAVVFYAIIRWRDSNNFGIAND